VGAVFGLSLEGGLDLVSLLSGEKLLWGDEHVVEHVCKRFNMTYLYSNQTSQKRSILLSYQYMIRESK